MSLQIGATLPGTGKTGWITRVLGNIFRGRAAAARPCPSVSKGATPESARREPGSSTPLRQSIRWRETGLHYRSGASELCDDDDATRYNLKRLVYFPKGRNRGLLTPLVGQIALARGDASRKRGGSAEKRGDALKKANRVRLQSSFRGGVHQKPRVLRGDLKSY